MESAEKPREDWRACVCPECGEVEEVDMTGSTAATPNNICSGCGSLMLLIDED